MGALAGFGNLPLQEDCFVAGAPGQSLAARRYALYDKLYRPDVLAYAYERCCANKGAATSTAALPTLPRLCRRSAAPRSF
jgi:hypothetical protein